MHFWNRNKILKQNFIQYVLLFNSSDPLRTIMGQIIVCLETNTTLEATQTGTLFSTTLYDVLLLKFFSSYNIR